MPLSLCPSITPATLEPTIKILHESEMVFIPTPHVGVLVKGIYVARWEGLGSGAGCRKRRPASCPAQREINMPTSK